MLVVEQDARIALNAAVDRLRARGRQGRGVRVERGAARRRGDPAELPRLLMAQFFQQVVSGLASGGIYGLLALALVLIHRATGVVNFAQGEMAMFSTYIAWTLTTNHGVGYWPAFVITLLVVVRRRLRDPPGGDPPRRARIADSRRDHHDRPAAAAQRARDLDLDGRGARGPEPVPRRHVRDRRASRSRMRTSARSPSASAP